MWKALVTAPRLSVRESRIHKIQSQFRFRKYYLRYHVRTLPENSACREARLKHLAIPSNVYNHRMRRYRTSKPGILIGSTKDTLFSSVSVPIRSLPSSTKRFWSSYWTFAAADSFPRVHSKTLQNGSRVANPVTAKGYNVWVFDLEFTDYIATL